MKKLLQAIINQADKKGISKHRSFEEFIEHTFNMITQREVEPQTELDRIYLETVRKNPFVDVFEFVGVEIGYFNKRLGQFMTPASVSAYLTLKSDHNEALDFSCGTGVNGLVMLAKMHTELTPIYNGKQLPTFIEPRIRQVLTLHLNDINTMMCKIAFIQVQVNFNIHCSNIFILDLLVSNNNVITEWETDLKVIYKQLYSRQTFTRLCDAHKPLLILNPPYGLKDYGYAYAKANTHQERFNDYIPLKGDCESAFILSALELMTDTGECVIVLPCGVNYSNDCKYVRKLVLDQSMMETNIAFPSKLFNETAIPTVGWILNKKKIFEKVRLINLADHKEALNMFKTNSALQIFKGYRTKLIINTENEKLIDVEDFDFENLENNFIPAVYDAKQNNKVFDSQELITLASNESEISKEDNKCA
ncbi:N-6 DNA methylase [Vibrio parahaemolyticus]|nr:N-6 DNA methylase [Vibrio parahaemolyticus]EIV1599727.1 N-6 DNA methylase [Vibrio parahaemolyticus]